MVYDISPYTVYLSSLPYVYINSSRVEVCVCVGGGGDLAVSGLMVKGAGGNRSMIIRVNEVHRALIFSRGAAHDQYGGRLEWGVRGVGGVLHNRPCRGPFCQTYFPC